MNVLLWILQVLLAVHTAMGAAWKFSHPERSVPSLKAIPHAVWLALSGVELLCVLGLVLPVLGHSLAILAPVAAACLIAEMLLFCVVHLASGGTKHGHLAYWLVVALLCAVVVYGRLALRPL